MSSSYKLALGWKSRVQHRCDQRNFELVISSRIDATLDVRDTERDVATSRYPIRAFHLRPRNGTRNKPTRDRDVRTAPEASLPNGSESTVGHGGRVADVRR